MWTFGKRIAVGFAISFVLLMGIGSAAYRSIEMLTKTSYSVAHTHQVLERIAGLLSQLKDAETGERGFIITGDEAYLEPYRDAIGSIPKLLQELRELTAGNPRQQKRVDAAEPLIQAKLAVLKRNIDAVRQAGGQEQAAKLVLSGEGKRYMDDLRTLTEQMEGEERELLNQRAEEVEAASGSARTTIVLGTLFCLVFISAAGFLLTRSLTNQIAGAVQHVQRSSTELQTAANQQTSGAKEQATAMSEITTTISELLATSRQIAESAQRVAQIAQQTVGAARSGEATVDQAHESIAGIRRQVDLVVSHMLDLGKKSQQIGAVLDIVSELAEQTNILAINATIEAAGAGESGKRFAVVANEIRELADRVAGSTKEIRVLIDDVRSAVNTTVMATETGSKAVDAGSQQFGEVAAAFKQIAGLVGATTEAAREIELSTKQQTSAVEQVNLATANVAQTTRETEVSSGQTLETVSQLASLSRDLLRLVRPQAAMS
ncbi:MAG TPA: CHASE3 domain-containing protein [Ideonella sp.]|nr:CHASE3 domain-containing protein [Ideonella sp.]